MTTTERLHVRLIKRDLEAEAELPDDVQRNVPGNTLRLVGANALQSSGDQMVNASTVLPWLFHAIGVPAALTGALVPIRESGSMLPQAFLTPLVIKVRQRKLVTLVGALVQALSVAVMAVTAAIGSGLAAGLTIIVALAVFSLGRCLTSIASKDVQARTVPKGERGQINGLATTASGLVAITLGLAVRALGEGLDAQTLAAILGIGSVLWVLVALVWWSVHEPVDAPSGRSQSDLLRDRGEGEEEQDNWFAQTLTLLREDATFRSFVTVRSFLLVSSLSPPFIVTLAVQAGAPALTGLGGFIIASGLAALLGGRIFGRMADRSSKRLMTTGAALASLVLLVLVLLDTFLDLDGDSLATYAIFVAAYFLVTMLHTGVRVGRKTYVVDMAEGDQRTTYVAVSNSAMGVVLLLVGAISSAIAGFGVIWALLFLAGLGVLGVVTSRRLPEVEGLA
ncbi:MFS transporter [Janibacter indicus]|uniref:Predicted arabinose efflux permease, MFS family n=1 Tax=Janibacter indicus TaxID=857417 RepID=A0A1W2A9W2_9MICO|nr:MFS transporter [Janibacter indicus]SMC57467.1 Predicted arabinose efflux permease, MFS family [Janibacter indicus]